MQFISVVFPNYECVDVMKPDFWLFLASFSKDFFLKMLYEDDSNYKRKGRFYNCSRSLFMELIVVREACDCS